jgi:hypothetical protein
MPFRKAPWLFVFIFTSSCRLIQFPPATPAASETSEASPVASSEPAAQNEATKSDAPAAEAANDSATGGTGADLQALISDAIAKNARRVEFPPGTHRIKAALHVEGAKNLVIDGKGARIVQTNFDVQVFRITRCDRLQILNLTVDYDPLPFTQGKVIASTADAIDVQLDNGYPKELKNYAQPADGEPNVSAEIFDRRTRRMKLDGQIVFPTQVTSPRRGVFRLHHTCDSWCNFELGDLAAIKSYGSPDGMAILIEESKGTVLRGVTIHASSAAGIYEWGGDGGSRLTYQITRGPTPPGAKEPRLLSTNRDGFHSYGVRRGPTLDGVLTEFCSDDGVNIHGNYNTVSKVAGDRVTFSTKFWSFTKPGDTVRFYDSETLKLRLEGPAIEAFEDGTADPWVRVSGADVVREGDLAFNASRQGSNAVIRNSTFRDLTGRGLILRGEGHRVENNTIERPTMSGIVLGAEVGGYQEGDFPRNIIVKGNTLREIGLSKRSRDGVTDQIGAISVLTMIAGDKREKARGHYHQRDIKIIENRIEHCGVAGILVADASNVKLCRNRLVDTNAAAPLKANDAIPGVKADAGIIVWDSQNVMLSGNTVETGAYANKKVSSKQATVTERATDPCD